MSAGTRCAGESFGSYGTVLGTRAAQWVGAAAILVALIGCGESRSSPAPPQTFSSTIVVLDDAGQEVRLDRPARRVLSLLPAGTETLFALGAAEAVVGRTRYDTDPAASHLPSVGGGLDPSLEAIVALDPDLVIAFETAGGSKLRARLEALGIAVFGIRTQDTTDILRNVQKVGALIGRGAAADSLLTTIRAELASMGRASAGIRPPTVAYVASVDPPIIAGHGTYIAELIGVAGGAPIDAGAAAGLWPQISLEELVRLQPDVVILPVGADPTASAERLRRTPGWRDLSAVREGRVAQVPADLMNRPGPRIPEVARVLRASLLEHWPPR